MTRSEQFRKSRAWLKTHRFVITTSLRKKLESVPLEDRAGYCYVQNMVLILTDEYEEDFARIWTGCWKDKLGSKYTRFVRQLREWGELEGDESDFRSSRNKSGYPRPYAVPLLAKESGTCIVDFERKRIRLPRPKNKPTDAVSVYALKCLSELRVAQELVYPPPEDPLKNTDIRKARIRQHCEHIAGGDFSLHYGDKAKRLYHRVLTMPKEGRCNLTLTYCCPLAEYDVPTCHPLLMLKFFTNPNERTKYAEMLSDDIYNCIGKEMGIDCRQKVKDDVQRVVNISHKKAEWMTKQYVFQFYAHHFPTFTEEFLFPREDLAACLQGFEAELMVQKLGTFCREHNLFWVPMHDGFIARMDQGDVISGQASKIIKDAVGFSTQMKCTPIESFSSSLHSVVL